MRCTNLQQISAADDFSKPLPIESHRKNNQPRVPKLLVNVLWFLGHVFLWLIHVNPTRWWVDLMEFRQKHQHVDFQKSFKVMAGWVVSIAYFDLQLGTIFHLSRTSCWRRTDLAWIFQQISQDGTGHVWTVVACASCAGSHGNHHGFAWQSRGNPKIESTGSFPLNHIKPLWILGAPFSDTPTLRFYTNHWQGNLMQSNSSCASKLEALKIRAERHHSAFISFEHIWAKFPIPMKFFATTFLPLIHHNFQSQSWPNSQNTGPIRTQIHRSFHQNQRRRVSSPISCHFYAQQSHNL